MSDKLNVPDPQPSVGRLWFLGPLAVIYYYVRNKRQGLPTDRIVKHGRYVIGAWFSGCCMVILLPLIILVWAASSMTTATTPTPTYFGTTPVPSSSTGHITPVPSGSTGNSATATPANSAPDALEQAQQTCQSFTDYVEFEPVQSIDNVIAYCGINLPQGSFNVEFGTNGQVYLNPCSDYAWVTANGDQQSSNCGAPAESASQAASDCQSGSYFNPDGLVGGQGTWNSEYDLCLLDDN
jgi:hypothetical protein